MKELFHLKNLLGRVILLGVLVFLVSFNVQGKLIVQPFETESNTFSTNPIDIYVSARLHKQGIEPANLCSDEVFIRRVYLDTIGTIPEPGDVQKFLKDSNPNKRTLLIDSLLKRDEFADYWAVKWCDLLRVKSEFPINLWPNAVQAYHRWIRDSIHNNKPYNVFVRELLTSSGSNFRVPPVNFYRAVQSRDSTALAGVVALNFMGTRFDKWSDSKRSGMTVFFSRVAYKYTDEWKEEIVYTNPTSSTFLDAVFPDGTKIKISPDKDPRQVFANWLISPDNPWFSRAIVNRIWSWLLGRGIIQEPDDIRPDNPPVNPELLTYLEKELVKSKYDLRHIYRIILNSRTYQQSPISQSNSPEADSLFAHYLVRRLDAETLIDAIDWVGGTGENYSSAIPEPYTFIPENKRTITLADGSITSQFLEMFGRPPRDTGLESERNNDPSDSQRLFLINSNEIQKKIEQSRRLRKVFDAYRKDKTALVRMIYMTLLSRYPTPHEIDRAVAYFQSSGLSQKQAADDLAWALVNSKEFLYRH